MVPYRGGRCGDHRDKVFGCHRFPCDVIFYYERDEENEEKPNHEDLCSAISDTTKQKHRIRV